SLPDLPSDDTWNMARISRDPSTGALATKLERKKLPAVEDTWHPKSIDYLSLSRVKQLTANTFEATCSDQDLVTGTGIGTDTVIAKIARFYCEIPRMAQETRIYKSLEGTGLAPRFLAHVHEHGRVIGILLEKLGGREAGIEDLMVCQSALGRLHDIGICHGDVNRYNFIVQGNTARLVDFERSHICPDAASLEDEMESLDDQLRESTGRGGGFRFAEG
ncbi:hypothetical protein P170DRAFT_352716, partial [Aspergillus steynii IBT 23096]